MESKFSAPDIVCDGCAGAIKRALGPVSGVSHVDVDVDAKTVTVSHEETTPREVLAEALARAGYPGSSGGESHHLAGSKGLDILPDVHTIGAKLAPSLVTIGGGAKVLDPVCGMTIDPASAAGSSRHGGVEHFFCSRSCKQKFDADPRRYLSDHAAGQHSSHHSGHAKSAGSDTATYTCPMHPEIVQQGPGSCPICGMALEPLTATADD
ncbi:heavy metal-binding domain-containing protein, partial [Singulisphaera rosea]